jgi:hypothetical protein
MEDVTAAALARAYARLLGSVAGETEPVEANAPRLLVATEGGPRDRLSELTAAYVLAGQPDVRPLSDLRRLIEPPT